MAKKPNERHLTFCIDEVVRDQFEQLCKTLDVSAGSVMRQWVETALEQGTIDFSESPKSSKNLAWFRIILPNQSFSSVFTEASVLVVH